MARQRKVFDNGMVAHVWAQMTQTCGYSYNRNLYFDGATLYSYGSHFVVGYLTDKFDGEGRRIALLNSGGYSMSTQRHQSLARGAVSHMRRFYVSRPRALSDHEHNRNIEDLLKQANAELAASMNTRRKADNRMASLEAARRRHGEAVAYASIFQPDRVVPSLDDTGAYFEELERKAEEARAAYLATQAEAERKLRVRSLGAWAVYAAHFRRTGENLFVYLCCRPVLMTVKGDQIVTSHGAKFPIKHGIRALRLICAARAAGREWTRNNAGPRLGHFQIDHIDAQGNVRAGCHAVDWRVIAMVAKQLGISA